MTTGDKVEGYDPERGQWIGKRIRADTEPNEERLKISLALFKRSNTWSTTNDDQPIDVAEIPTTNDHQTRNKCSWRLCCGKLLGIENNFLIRGQPMSTQGTLNL